MEHSLDVRGLSPPKPMEHILDALTDMAEGDHLHVYLDRDPVPLYPLLSTMSHRWYRRERDHGPVELYIWQADQPVPDVLLE